MFLTDFLLVGGYKNQKSAYLSSKKTNQWSGVFLESASRRSGHGSIVINNECYVFGGVDNKKIDKYIPITNKFVTLNFMDVERSNFGYTTFGKDSFIVAGGSLENPYIMTNTYFMYNTTSNTFKKVGSLNTERGGFVLVNCMGTIYAIGGSSSIKSFKSIEKYDSITNKWKILSSRLKKKRYFHQAVAYGELIFIIGGKDRKLLRSIEKFNTNTGEVIEIEGKLSTGRFSFATLKINNTVQIVGGVGKSLGLDVVLSFTEIFDLDSETVQHGGNVLSADAGSTTCVGTNLVLDKNKYLV